MPSRPIPLVILGGSDGKPTELPPAGRGKHPLVGYKGVDIRVGGRPLVTVLVERIRSCGAFSPILIAGPRDVYERAGVPAQTIDTDGSFGENIRAGIESVIRDCPEGPMAITTCDILPEVEQLKALLEDYHADAPYDLWYPLILVPAESQRLGAFAWKPKYKVIPSPGAEPVAVLPGHLAIFDPHALRLDFLYRLLQVGYRTRNRPIAYRRGYMVRQTILRLLAQDLIHLLTLRVPNVTWSVIANGLAAARKLKAGTISRSELEGWVRKIFARTKHRRRHPERRMSFPVLQGLSLAEDIDTMEEAEQIGGVRE